MFYFDMPSDCGLEDCHKPGTYLRVNGEFIEASMDYPSGFLCEEKKRLIERAFSAGFDNLSVLKIPNGDIDVGV